MRSISASTSGFSVLELMISIGVLSWAGIVVARMIIKPVQAAAYVSLADQKQQAYAKANIPIDDLKSAWSVTVQWTAINPSETTYNSAIHPFQMPWFQVHNNPGVTPAFSFVCYYYRSTDGAVVRVSTMTAPAILTQCPAGGGEEKVIATNVLTPTVSNPLFRKDAASQNLAVVTLRFRAVSGKPADPPVTVVRRAFIRA